MYLRLAFRTPSFLNVEAEFVVADDGLGLGFTLCK